MWLLGPESAVQWKDGGGVVNSAFVSKALPLSAVFLFYLSAAAP